MTDKPFTRGAKAAFDGLRIALGDRGVRAAYLRVVLALLGLTLLIDGLGLWGLFHWIDPANADAAWLAGLYWVARILGSLAILLVGPMIAILAMNVAFPFFNVPVFMAGMRAQDPARADRLAAKPGMSLSASAGIAAIRLGRYLGLTIVFMLIGLVPVVGNIIGTIGQLWLTARTVSWELMDPYFDRLDMGLADQKRFVGEHERALLGFGVPLALLMAIPLVGPLMFGWAQGAAAMFVVREVPPDPREFATSDPGCSS